MQGNMEARRGASLRTYSRRVNRSVLASQGKSITHRESANNLSLPGEGQRRVLGAIDENQSHASPLKSRQHSNSSTLSTKPSILERHALLEINYNQFGTRILGPLPDQSQKRGETAPHKTSLLQNPTSCLGHSKHTKKNLFSHSSKKSKSSSSQTVEHSSLVTDKKVICSVSASSPTETREDKQTLSTESSHPDTQENSASEFPTPHLEKKEGLVSNAPPTLAVLTPDLERNPKKRRFPDTKSTYSKRVKPSSIESYFKPLSSSSSPAVTPSTSKFSDDASAPCTPPTSPISGGASPKYRLPGKKTRRNISIKRLPRSAMDDPRPSNPIKIPAGKGKPVKYEQLRLNSLSSANIMCTACGMTYNPTVDEDIQAHDQMHSRRNPITTKRILDSPLWDTARIDGIHAIYVNRRHPERNERKWFEHALDMLVDHGLKDSFSLDLWKSMYVNQRKLAQYKIYVYLIDDKIVSIALAKRIFKAGSFYSGWKTHDASGKLAIPDRSKTQEYVDMDWSFPVVVSIDRLWTDPAHHRRGFATALLEQLRGDWVFGTHLSKKLIAFSIPTAQGKKFATKYFRGVFPGCPFVVDPYDAPMVLEDGVLKNDYELKRVKSGLMFSTEDLN